MSDRTPETIPYFLRDKIRALIVDGTFQPGQPLREQELERRFGSSRGPIREALRLLEQTGLVSHIQRRGFRVTLYDTKDIRDQYLLRAELVSYAIRNLAQVADLGKLIEQLQACRARLETAHRERDPQAYLTEINRFYGALAQYTGNRPLCEALTRLNETAEPLRYNLLSRQLRSTRVQDYAKRIIQALKGGRYDEAAEIQREHILLNLPNVIETYEAARYQESCSLPSR